MSSAGVQHPGVPIFIVGATNAVKLCSRLDLWEIKIWWVVGKKKKVVSEKHPI